MGSRTTGSDLDILVVDDEPALSALVARVLGLEGHRVRTSRDGRDGLAAIAERRPDVVVLDVMMPGLDGWGVLEHLAEEPTTAELPIVMLTALSSEQDVIRAHLTGAVRYVTKPFEVDELLRTILAAAEPPSDAERAERRRQLRGFLARLAELDAGRRAAGPRIRFSGLEAMPLPERPSPAPGIEALTPHQRHVAGLFAEGVPARAIAERLGTSRSNVYATRARIARHLGVPAEAVVETTRRLGLHTATSSAGPSASAPPPGSRTPPEDVAAEGPEEASGR